MNTLIAYISLTRPANVVLAVSATALGTWLSRFPPLFSQLPFLVLAAGSATGFGNVVNDLVDIEGDRINHPQRPLARGLLSPVAAIVWAIVLAVTALGVSGLVSPVHVVATAIPLGLLLLYTIALKGIPLLGNLVVASLVAYPVLFGALGSPGLTRLFIPATLALLLNVTREIVKDVQDRDGDRAVGLRTSATLPLPILWAVVLLCDSAYLSLLFVPTVLGQFGIPYALVCATVIVPLHLVRTYVFFRSDTPERYHRVSGLLKAEMAAGLLALGLDEIMLCL